MENVRSIIFNRLKKVIIKIGTKIILNDNGSIDQNRINTIIKEISALKSEGYSIVLVSSGAVGLGMSLMGYKKRPTLLADKQACAAAGQIRLMHLYAEKFKVYKQNVAQALLSADDFKHSDRFNNIRRTIQSLLAHNIIPIINENDTISTEEIKVGDNDKLSSDVAHFLEAELLVILSDEKGLYTKNPKLCKDARLLSVVPKITTDIEKMGGGAGSIASVGGMRAKLRAIKQATQGGTPVVLTNGKRRSLYDLVHGKQTGTLFLPNSQKLNRKKRWLAFVSNAHGKIFLDSGGISIVSKGKSSILAVGVVSVKGNFKAGDFVEVGPLKGPMIGRGRVSYSSNDINKIMGHKSNDILKILKTKGPEEVIHKDNLVIY